MVKQSGQIVKVLKQKGHKISEQQEQILEKAETNILKIYLNIGKVWNPTRTQIALLGSISGWKWIEVYQALKDEQLYNGERIDDEIRKDFHDLNQDIKDYLLVYYSKNNMLQELGNSNSAKIEDYLKSRLHKNSFLLFMSSDEISQIPSSPINRSTLQGMAD
jgi:hypothetical protein